MYSGRPSLPNLPNAIPAPPWESHNGLNVPPQPKELPTHPTAALPRLTDLYSTTTSVLESLKANVACSQQRNIQGSRPHAPPPMGTTSVISTAMTSTWIETPTEAATAGGKNKKDKGDKAKEPANKNRHLRKAAGKIWNDPNLEEWNNEDYRVFCGDLGNEVTDEVLANAFRHLRSFGKAKVIRDSKTGKTKGYGFASFGRPEDMLIAMKTIDRKYVGNRPIRVLKSKWKDREIDSEKNKAEAGSMRLAEVNSKSLKRFKIVKKDSKAKTTTEGDGARSGAISFSPNTGSVNPGSNIIKQVFTSDTWMSRFKEI